MFRILILLFGLSYCHIVSGQDMGAYNAQFEAVRSLLVQGQYVKARKQATGLVEIGQQSLLTNVEAEAQLLVARSWLDDPRTSGRKQANGIKALRQSAKLFSRLRDAEAVNRVLAELSGLLGEELSLSDLNETSSRSRKARLRRNDSLLVEKELLDALVSSQEATIMALNDSQMRQMLELQKQQARLDSFAINALEDSLLVVKQSMQIETQKATIQARKQQRNFLFLCAVTILGILGVLYWRYLASRRYQKDLQEKNERIESAKQRSDDLLLNILPAAVATELKQNGKAQARRHPMVSVLFADFKGFSQLAADMEANQIVSILDEAFQAFDRIGREYGLEKIKTIGDAYMAATGLPDATEDHAEKIVLAGLKMQVYLEEHPHFSARIGIHSGPVVAGVVGLDKFAYDIWGDTVNRAARLEVAGEAGQVNISSSTKDLLPAANFSFESRGVISVKNIGEMEMFFVHPT